MSKSKTCQIGTSQLKQEKCKNDYYSSDQSKNDRDGISKSCYESLECARIWEINSHSRHDKRCTENCTESESKKYQRWNKLIEENDSWHFRMSGNKLPRTCNKRRKSCVHSSTNYRVCRPIANFFIGIFLYIVNIFSLCERYFFSTLGACQKTSS